MNASDQYCEADSRIQPLLSFFARSFLRGTVRQDVNIKYLFFLGDVGLTLVFFLMYSVRRVPCFLGVEIFHFRQFDYDHRVQLEELRVLYYGHDTS